MIFSAIIGRFRSFADYSVIPPRAVSWPNNSSYLEVFVSAVEHPHHFWCQILSGAAAKLDDLTQQMTEFYSSSAAPEEVSVRDPFSF